MGEGNFFDRWARRKAEARAGTPTSPEADPDKRLETVLPAAAVDLPSDPRSSDAVTAEDPATGPESSEHPLTLEDAQALTPTSDFSPFMNAGVEPDVRNAALKQLFTDPHFNQIDGLDVYLDDYSKMETLPASMARKLVSSKFMGLFDEKEEVVPATVSQPSLAHETAQPPMDSAPSVEADPDGDAAPPAPTSDDAQADPIPDTPSSQT